MPSLVVVAIGRNEGDRLVASLQSVMRQQVPLVYVDSGSHDGSAARARALGAAIVELDAALPFTAARARNAGFERALQLHPDAVFVQFVDADCELEPGWLAAARVALEGDGRLGVVFGRRREREPERSIYNLLCDVSWDGPPGDATACGGDAMMRVDAFGEAGGFDASLIAGEESDLCIRLRRRGWKVRRLPAPMTRHDARMVSFGQWWQRARRTGYAYAEGSARYGQAPERHWVKESRSAWCWSLVAVAAVLLGPVTAGWSLALLGVWPLQVLRIALRERRRPLAPRTALLYGLFCMLGKFPEALGQVRYQWSRWRGAPSRLMEYRGEARP